MTRQLFYFVSLIATIGLSGCAVVYAPTVPATPLVEKGEVETSLALRSLRSLEPTVAWAPTRHLLLTAEGGFQNAEGYYVRNSRDTLRYNDHNRLGSLGVGYYNAAPDGLYFAAVGNVGYAAADVLLTQERATIVLIPSSVPLGRVQARYWRYSGQVYVAQRSKHGASFGGSLRFTCVNYSQFRTFPLVTGTGDTLTATPLNSFFLEPMLMGRFGSGAVRGQYSVGMSIPLSQLSPGVTDNGTAPISSLLSVGVVLRPDLLVQGIQRHFRNRKEPK